MIEIYHDTVPRFVQEFAQTEEMLRLKDIGMDCGCEYTSFSLWDQLRPYRRYEHSLGVALIVYHFTGDIKQTVAALLHDIASPVFAHVVDFMNHDYTKQESTEERTREIIENSQEIMALLKKYGLKVDDVSDYHQYSIADNDTPRLSADRLEYTLENMSRFLKVDEKIIKEFYDDLTVGINEEGQQELMFRTPHLAHDFTLYVIRNSWIYVSDPDRYSMERLARILRKAVDEGIILPSDLYATETAVIGKLENDGKINGEWQQYRKIHTVRKSVEQEDDSWLMIDGKKRYIDSYIINSGRVSVLYWDCRKQIQDFVKYTFDYYVKGFPAC